MSGGHLNNLFISPIELREGDWTMRKVYKNTYTPTKVEIDDYHPDTPEDDYDHNFVFEVKALKSERVELRPFIVGPLLSTASQTHALAIPTFEITTARSPRCP
jgi:hypothetical protein